MCSDHVESPLELVRRSPAACAVHDRAAWLDLFASDGQINDPEGARPHQGISAIERFYDTFIAPNALNFAVDHDVVCGLTVVRDLTIETTMASGLKINVPTHIRYHLVDTPGGLKIGELHAHWELLPMVGQTLAAGFKGLRTYASLSVNMLRQQGLFGVLGFMRGFGGVGRKGKAVAQRLIAALCAGNVVSASGMLAGRAIVRSPDGQPSSPDALADVMRGMQSSKLIAAGRFVTATLIGADSRAVIAIEFGPKKTSISSICLYAG